MMFVSTITPAEDHQLVSQKSFIPYKEWKDDKGVHINAHGGGFLQHNNTWYWFGEHKIAGGIGNTAQVGVGVYSSQDLYNWKNEGIALTVHQDPESEIVKGSIIERPKVIYNKKTGKFVMWFHLELKGRGYEAARVGVAIADEVAGPYTFLESYRPQAGILPINAPEKVKQLIEADNITKQTIESLSVEEGRYLLRDYKVGQMSRDMTLYIDEDNTAYHITSSEENRTLHVHQLTDDYQSYTGKYSRILPNGANEAPAIFKHEGKYYLLASGLTGWAPNPARSAVAENIFGPWKSLGNPIRGTNSHNQLGPEKTFGGQSTYILPIEGKDNAWIAMFDVWRPRNPIDGSYIWLPIQMKENHFEIHWKDQWDLNEFNKSEN